MAVLAMLVAFMVIPPVFETLSGVFAAEVGAPLKLTESYPQNDDNHMPIQNVGIKLFFDGNVTAENVQKNNSNCFKLTDSNGKIIRTEAYYGTKRNDYILVAVASEEGSLEPKSEYTLTISESLASSDSRTLSGGEVIKFMTVDTTGNTQVYMLLMLVMVAGMIGMTVISNRRKAKAEAEALMKEGKVNPYKLAKDKGITLQQALAQIEKEKEKKAKRISAATGESRKKAEAETKKPESKRVKGARPVSAGGSAYKTGRKAIAERKAKAEAAKRAKAPANAKAKKGKGKHKR
jgi:hypothetical protein